MKQENGLLNVFVSHSADGAWLAQQVITFLEEAGHSAATPYTLGAGDALVSSVYASIQEADAAVVILDGASPNVYYEAGAAAASGKPLLLVGGSDRMPSDLLGYPHILTGTSPKWWRSGLAVFLSSVRTKVPSGATRQGAPTLLRDLSALVGQPLLLNNMRHRELSGLVGALLDSRGYSIEGTEVAPAALAGGRVDLLARTPQGVSLVVECKATPAGARSSVDAVQQLEYYTQHMPQPASGLLVTTGQFSDAARSYAATASVPIELWDADALLHELESAAARQPTLTPSA
jgi:hypothetical protein